MWQKYLILAILWSFVISCDPSCVIACGGLRFSRWPHKRSYVVNFYLVIFKFTDYTVITVHVHIYVCFVLLIISLTLTLINRVLEITCGNHLRLKWNITLTTTRLLSLPFPPLPFHSCYFFFSCLCFFLPLYSCSTARHSALVPFLLSFIPFPLPVSRFQILSPFTLLIPLLSFSVCLCVKNEPCRSDWTDRDAVWNVDAWRLRNYIIIRSGPDFFYRKAVLLWHVRGRYVHRYSQGQHLAMRPLGFINASACWRLLPSTAAYCGRRAGVTDQQCDSRGVCGAVVQRYWNSVTARHLAERN